MRRLEDFCQANVIEYLAWVAPRVFTFAIPNASKRSRGGKASNAVPGLRPGVADLGLILPNGVTAYMEVKTPVSIKKRNRSMSDEQLDFEAICKARGAPHAVVADINDVRHALADWGVTTRDADALCKKTGARV
jgi:hypothetical protein